MVGYTEFCLFHPFFPTMLSKSTHESKLPLLLLLQIFNILFLCKAPVAEALVHGGTGRVLSSSIGDLLLQTVTAARTFPFPLPVPPMASGRLNPLEGFRENRRNMVSLFAMGLTKGLEAASSPSDATTTFSTSSSKGQLWSLAPAAVVSKKLCNLPNDELAEIILRDSRERQFLYTADMTRAIYHESCLFKDGSDIDGSYPLEAWVRGCKLLFDANQSQCKILEHTLTVTNRHIRFRFAETLTFKTMLQPRVYLTGTVVMTRDERSGLISSYEEKWDQDMNEIFRRTKFTII